MDGKVHTFKAHLVAKGYTKTYGVDYGETFSSVADIRAIEIILAITVFYDYEIWKMDVKKTFLNGHLSEDIYMVQPEGFVDPKHPKKEIKNISFTQNPDEPYVYLKASGSSVAFLVLYANDKLLMGNSVAMLQKVKSWLIKGLSRENLKKFRMENSKKGYTLMMEKPDYRMSQGAKIPSELQHMQRVPYASAIGSIMYAVRFTRPDVAFAQTCVVVFSKIPKNAKQSTTAMSSTEAEYIAAAEASMAVVWMRKFIDGLGDVVPSNKRPMEMLCD
nr:hypothetical protein [Tanacetum cinerariifolium]